MNGTRIKNNIQAKALWEYLSSSTIWIIIIVEIRAFSQYRICNIGIFIVASAKRHSRCELPAILRDLSYQHAKRRSIIIFIYCPGTVIFYIDIY